MKSEKMSSKERQELIIHSLKQAKQPITGREFATMTNVSRQVIVQDVSLLKAKGENIIATSQGYTYVKQNEKNTHQMIIVCQHTDEQTADELFLIVDHGVTVKDVIIEHPVYGDITASIHVSDRFEVNQFLEKIKRTKASYLSSLTEGLHLHTLEADNEDKLKAVCYELENAGILIKQSN